MIHSTASAQVILNQQKQRSANTRLSGRRLVQVRVVWAALVLFMLTVFIASLPASYATLHQSCIGTWCANANGQLTASEIRALPARGLSLDAYALSWIVINGGEALVCGHPLPAQI